MGQWSNTREAFSAWRAVRMNHKERCVVQTLRTPHCPGASNPVRWGAREHSPAHSSSGGNSPVIHHAINIKGVTVVTTRAKKGGAMFTNKCTSIFLKAEECSHSLNYFSLNGSRTITAAFPTGFVVSLAGDTKFQTSLLLILSTVRNARLGIQLVWALLRYGHKKDPSIRNKMTSLALKAGGRVCLKMSKPQIYAVPLSAK